MDNIEITSLHGPVEKLDGELVLRIPLQAGRDQLRDCSRGISEVRDGCLVITIQEWLAGMLRIEEGSVVAVDNRNGKCNIRSVNPLPLQ